MPRPDLRHRGGGSYSTMAVLPDGSGAAAALAGRDGMIWLQTTTMPKINGGCGGAGAARATPFLDLRERVHHGAVGSLGSRASRSTRSSSPMAVSMSPTPATPPGRRSARPERVLPPPPGRRRRRRSVEPVLAHRHGVLCKRLFHGEDQTLSSFCARHPNIYVKF